MPSLIARMKDEVTWEARKDPAYTASSGYTNAPDYEAGIALRAQVLFTPRLSRNDQGEETVAMATAWIATGDDIVISSKDRITFPDGSTPKILNISRSPDGRGAYNVSVVMFGGR